MIGIKNQSSPRKIGTPYLIQQSQLPAEYDDLRQRELNPILKDYLLQHKVLVQYLHDLYGFRRGVLVATGKDRIGWSSVSDHDVEIRRIDPLKLPAIQGLVKKGAPIAEIMSNKAYEKQSKKTAPSLFRYSTSISVFFLQLAEPNKAWFKPCPGKHLKSAIQEMKEKASRHFK